MSAASNTAQLNNNKQNKQVLTVRCLVLRKWRKVCMFFIFPVSLTMNQIYEKIHLNTCVKSQWVHHCPSFKDSHFRTSKKEEKTTTKPTLIFNTLFQGLFFNLVSQKKGQKRGGWSFTRLVSKQRFYCTIIDDARIV